MKSDFYYFLAILGFCSAIFLCSFFNIGITFSVFLVFISIVLFLFNKFLLHDIKNSKKITLIIILIFSFALGIFRYEIKDNSSLDKNLQSNLNKKIIIIGTIVDEPTKKEKQAVFTVQFRRIETKDGELDVQGKGLVSADLYPEYKYGDEVRVFGKLEKPENFNDQFDYISYLSKDDIFYKINFAKLELISSGNGNFIKSMLFDFKNSFVENINKTISEPESSLLSGILLGAKSSIDQNTTEDFRKAGLSHIVALSGYNITIVADVIMKVLSTLPKTFGFLGGIFGIVLFVLMTGGTSTAVRAAIMALIVILAKASYRNYQAGRALVVAGVLMVILNPKILVFDISFQLSFLATVAIIYVAPILNKKFTFITEKFNLREIISSTVSAQILVLPLILYKMGMLSAVALPANILVSFFIPASMLFGFIVGILGFIWYILALPFAWVSWVILAYIIRVASIFANLPFSAINISWFSSGIMTMSYIFMAIWIVHENNKLMINS